MRSCSSGGSAASLATATSSISVIYSKYTRFGRVLLLTTAILSEPYSIRKPLSN